MSEILNESQVGKDYYKKFQSCTFRELEDNLLSANSHEEKAFYRSLLNLKMQIAQEHVVGEKLV